MPWGGELPVAGVAGARVEVAQAQRSTEAITANQNLKAAAARGENPIQEIRVRGACRLCDMVMPVLTVGGFGAAVLIGLGRLDSPAQAPLPLWQ